MAFVTRFLRFFSICRALKTAGDYFLCTVDSERDDFQLRLLNEVWRDAFMNVPFYKKWKTIHNLPDEISSLEEYSKWPILTKSDLQKDSQLLVRNTLQKSFASVTGGATGEPLHFRNFATQSEVITSGLMIARATLGIFPGDRTFLFWGHRHFYGHGFLSKLRFFIRRCKDFLNNTYRADACDLSEKYLRKVERKIRNWNPKVIISYSASMLALTRDCRERGVKFSERGALKVIICSAGSLSLSERKEITDFWGVPVYMEYGAMDAGLMAYMTPSGRYMVMHQSKILHTLNDGVGDLNLVTTLQKCYLPLFRYKIGDYLSGCTYSYDGRVLTIGEVWGRSNDEVLLPSGQKVHAYAFMVLAEENAKILAYQIVKYENKIELHLQTSSKIMANELDRIKSKAYSIVPELKDVSFFIVETQNLKKAPSGKILLVVNA